MNVLLISGFVHVAAIVILGGITIVKFIIPDDTSFEEPPAIEEIEPPKDVKVEIKQSAPKNLNTRNLQVKQVGNIAIDSIDVDLPSMQQSFTVSAGLGGSGGNLLSGTRGSIGLGVSDVNVFGLKSRAERFLFVVDANREMLVDEKGGLNSYRIIKNEISDMVGNLSTGTLFNVMLFDNRKAMLFKPQLVPAGTQVHQELKAWISQINSSVNNLGLPGPTSTTPIKITALSNNPIHDDLYYSAWQNNQTAYITQVALEQKVEAIYFITGYHEGFTSLRRKPTAEEAAERKSETASAEYQEQLAKHQAEIPKMQERIKKELAKINAARKAKGQPPRVLARGGHTYAARTLGLEWENPLPERQEFYYHNERETERYYKDLMDVLYEDNMAKKASLNLVLFLAGDEKFGSEKEDSVSDFVRFFSGKYRIIRGLNEIRSAQSASETTN